MPKCTTEWIAFITLCGILLYVFYLITKEHIKINKEIENWIDSKSELTKSDEYWIEETVRRNGKTTYSIESHGILLPSMCGGKYFDNKQDAINQLNEMIKRRIDNEVVSKKRIYPPTQQEDRRVNLSKNPKL